ncbi:hypothetical protein Vadar_020266 [Vaccinium darrowii]|uniref:Uncharacterized protein n=1 Tax=Vaccinium darrowii TaxID=229202 RepID=A0ACB7YFX5_9ERIC|nr:hypothetical protein Vadar_020266 [Vaccinium darrowii]
MRQLALSFDTFLNAGVDPNSHHIGVIDVNSFMSVTYLTWRESMVNTETATAWVNYDYDSTTKTLSVYLTYEENPVFEGNYNLSYVIDLRKFLPEWVSVGFSAATGSFTETHNIVSWTFNSTLGGSYDSTSGGSSNSTGGGLPSNSTSAGSPS